jgi:hypothetical protein
MLKDTRGAGDQAGPTIHDSRFTIHDWPKRLLAVQVLVAAGLAPWYPVYGLHVDWSSAWPLPLAQLALGGAWLYYRRYAGHPHKFIIPDVILATALLLLLTNIVSPAQYLAVALRRPLIDDWLVRADAWLGIDVAALAAWTRAHGTISLILTACYATLLPQFLMPLLVLGLRHKDRAGMWEYLFHFHCCLLVTLASLALFPAECAFTHLGYTSTIDQTRFLQQFTALRAGTFDTINFMHVEGLISMPSFHAAGALMVTWAFRRHRAMFSALVVLNTGLIAATFFSGAHYFVDVLASGALFGISVCAYRLLSRAPVAAPSEALARSWAKRRWPRAARATTD